MKFADTAKDFDEDFLGEVGRFGAVLHGARQQGIDRLVIARDQPRERLLRSGLKFCDQCRLFGLEASTRWLDCPW